MDINTIGVATVAAIIVICYLIGMIVKATALDNKWIPILCGLLGGLPGPRRGLFYGGCRGHYVRPDRNGRQSGV